MSPSLPKKTLAVTFGKPLTQAAIRAAFPVELAAAEARLCRGGCQYWTSFCFFALLPLTPKGEDCPYYQRMPPEEDSTQK